MLWKYSVGTVGTVGTAGTVDAVGTVDTTCAVGIILTAAWFAGCSALGDRFINDSAGTVGTVGTV